MNKRQSKKSYKKNCMHYGGWDAYNCHTKTITCKFCGEKIDEEYNWVIFMMRSYAVKIGIITDVYNSYLDRRIYGSRTGTE